MAIITTIVVSMASSALAANSVTRPDTGVGGRPSFTLDAAGNPVIAYNGSNTGDLDLRVMRCNDPDCAGDDESITTPDTSVGQGLSLALDAAGNPVVAYSDWPAQDLHVMHCNDPDCAGDDESIATPDPGVETTRVSLVLDGIGNPVIAYDDLNTRDLRVMHCNDPNCAGDDESISTIPDVQVGGMDPELSLVLNSVGNPQVAYPTWSELSLLTCNDPDCTGDDETVNMIDSAIAPLTPSMVLDAAGNPLIAYGDEITLEVALVRCNDPVCAGDDESVGSLVPGDDPSIVLDGSGNPVISYRSFVSGATGSDLAVQHCNDPDCAGDDELISVPDTEGLGGNHSQLVLDGSANPVVVHIERVGDASPHEADLKVVHCGDPTCGATPPTTTEPTTTEPTTTAVEPPASDPGAPTTAPINPIDTLPTTGSTTSPAASAAIAAIMAGFGASLVLVSRRRRI